MEISLGSLKGGAEEAQGTTIIIDVFRAFTTAAIAFDRGANEIVLFPKKLNLVSNEVFTQDLVMSIASRNNLSFSHAIHIF